MSNSIAYGIMENLEDTLDIVARSLRDASERTHDLSEEASDVLSKAATDVIGVAERLRDHALEGGKDIASQASREVQDHPIASLAAALAAMAALVGVIAVARRHKDAATAS